MSESFAVLLADSAVVFAAVAVCVAVVLWARAVCESLYAEDAVVDASVAVCLASVETLRALSDLVTALETFVVRVPSSVVCCSMTAFAESRSDATFSALDWASAAACFAATAFASTA